MPTSMGPRSSSRVIARSVVSISLSLKSRNIPHAMKSSYVRFCNVDITNAICGSPDKMKFNFSSYVLSLVDREVPLRKDCEIRDTWKLYLAITSSWLGEWATFATTAQRRRVDDVARTYSLRMVYVRRHENNHCLCDQHQLMLHLLVTRLPLQILPSLQFGHWSPRVYISD